MTRHEPRWERYTRAAVGLPQQDGPQQDGPQQDLQQDPQDGPQQSPQGSRRRNVHRKAGEQAQKFWRATRERLTRADAAQEKAVGHQRPDMRLLPAAVATWGTAMLAVAWPGKGGPALWCGGAVLLGCLFFAVLSARAGWQRARGLRPERRRQGLQSSAPTIMLAVLCMGAVLLSVGLRLWNAATSPLAQAVAAGQPLVITLDVDTAPRHLDTQATAPRVDFTATIVQVTAHGHALNGNVSVRVVADGAWAQLQPGDRVTTAGSVERSAGADAAAGVLRPATVPQRITPMAHGTGRTVLAVRHAWVAAVQKIWGDRNADVAGLLPGMVMGERNGLAPALKDSMKTVGLTHLTAVSGANCTLVLASLLLLLRTARAPRLLAGAVSLTGLGTFVLVVGPDPSVLRAAVMGTLGAMALLSGRPKRVGALLAASVLVLLLIDPWLSTDYAFVLSVLATLGLHLVGRRCVVWLSALLPLWLAQAVAIPLAAQLFCAPVLVLLQARLTPYTLVANMLAAPVVVLVTTVGTLGLALALVVPPLGALCAAVAGTGAWWVAAVARTMSALPGSSLPWPAGVQGAVLMAILNTVVVLALAAVVERQRAVEITTWLTGAMPLSWRRHRLGLAALAAAAFTAWWSAAVVGL